MTAVGITVTGVHPASQTWVDVIDALSDQALRGLAEVGCPVRAGLRLVELSSDGFAGSRNAEDAHELRYEAHFEVIA